MPLNTSILGWLDVALMAAGGVVLLAAAWRWRARGDGDPLRGSPLRPNRLSALQVWLCVAVNILGGWLGAALAPRTAPPTLDPQGRELWQTVLSMNLAVLLVIATCLIVARQAFPGGLAGLGLRCSHPARQARYALGGWLAAITLCGLMVMATDHLLHWLAPQFKPPEHPVFLTLEDPTVSTWMRVLALVGAFLLAPAGEELLFRGILQSALQRIMPVRWGSLRHRWLAIGLTALFFGALHLPTPHYVPALIALGLLLGFLYERSGSLLVPMLVHMLFNGRSLLWRELEHWYELHQHVVG